MKNTIKTGLIIGVLIMQGCDKASSDFARSDYDLLKYNAQGQTVPVKTVQDWQANKADILRRMQLVMGPLPQKQQQPVSYKILEEKHIDGMLLQKISYAVAENDFVPAYLLIPAQKQSKMPAMLCLHQTIDIGKGEVVGLGGNPNLHYGLELAKRGYVVIAPDYMRFGDNSTDPYAQGYKSASIKGVINHRRALDLLESLPYVDADKIGCIGHSLGGYNALFIAAFDDRVKAVVVSCGFISFKYYNKGDLTVWSSHHHMPAIASEYGCDPNRVPFDFHEVIAAIAPRPVFINAPLKDAVFDNHYGVGVCIDSARKVYDLYDASKNLAAFYPDCKHSFPADVRFKSYDFLDSYFFGSK